MSGVGQKQSTIKLGARKSSAKSLFAFFSNVGRVFPGVIKQHQLDETFAMTSATSEVSAQCERKILAKECMEACMSSEVGDVTGGSDELVQSDLGRKHNCWFCVAELN